MKHSLQAREKDEAGETGQKDEDRFRNLEADQDQKRGQRDKGCGDIEYRPLA